MEETIENIRFVQPVDFNTEFEKAAIIAASCALIAAGISITASFVKIRMEARAARKLMDEIEERKKNVIKEEVKD